MTPGSATSRDPRTWSRAKRNRYGWFMTFSLLFLMMLSWADKAVLGIAAVPLMKQLGITPEQFGLVGSAMFLTFGVAQIVAAPIANKVSSKWILLVLCLLWSVAQVPILLFASLPALWASRLLLGAGEGPLAPVLMHGIYKWFPAEEGRHPCRAGVLRRDLGHCGVRSGPGLGNRSIRLADRVRSAGHRGTGLVRLLVHRGQGRPLHQPEGRTGTLTASPRKRLL